MVDERQSSKAVKVAAKVITSVVGSVCILSLFALCWLLASQGFKGASDEMTLTRWLFLAVAAFALVPAIGFASAIYTTWFPKVKADATGPLERRGSPSLGQVRDDDFERQLNWLRSHKRLVKAIEGVIIAVLVLIAFLYGIHQ